MTDDDMFKIILVFLGAFIGFTSAMAQGWVTSKKQKKRSEKLLSIQLNALNRDINGLNELAKAGRLPNTELPS